MSMDYYIYLKQLDCFDANAFEQYAKSLNLHINLPPTFDIFNTSDFTPIRFTQGETEHMTGFEFENYAYCPGKPKNGIFWRL